MNRDLKDKNMNDPTDDNTDISGNRQMYLNNQYPLLISHRPKKEKKMSGGYILVYEKLIFLDNLYRNYQKKNEY